MSIGPPELILILVIVLIVFGAGKLPQVGSALGKGIREFRDASEGHNETAPPPTDATTTVIAPAATTPVSTPPAATPVVAPPPEDSKNIV